MTTRARSPGEKDLILLREPFRRLLSLDGPPSNLPAQELQRAGLLSGADQPGIDDGGVVGGKDPGGAPIRPL